MLQNIEQKETMYTRVFPAFVLLAGVVYAYFTLTAPPTTAGKQLGLVGMKLLLVQLTFTVPFIATWVVGSLAARNLKRYAGRITDSSEALGYRYFAAGIVFLVLGAVTAQVVGLPRNFYEGNVEVIAFLSVLANYINVLYIDPDIYFYQKPDPVK